MTPDRERRLLVIVIGFWLLIAFSFVLTIQPGYGPDEGRHFRYTRLLAEERRLPVRLPEGELQGAHTLHPPLYYLITLPAYCMFRGAGPAAALWAIKLMSPFLILASLLLFHRTLLLLWPDNAAARLTVLASIAFLPELMLEAGVMNNDLLAILLAALFLYLLVAGSERPPDLKFALAAGLIMALFANTKATAWTLAPLWMLSIWLRARRGSGSRTAWMRDLAAGYGVLLLLGTWWYVRNYQLYGAIVPLDFGAAGELRPYHPRTMEPLSPLEVYTSGYVVTYGFRAAEGLFQSFWTQIDWIREEWRPAVFTGLFILTLSAAAGWLRAGILRLAGRNRQVEPAALPLPRMAALLPVAAWGLNLGHTWFIASFQHLGFYQGGRYLMPSLLGAGILLGGGWLLCFPKRCHPLLPAAAASIFLVLDVLCLYQLITYLNPRYVQPFQG